jgi:hypothetical protein
LADYSEPKVFGIPPFISMAENADERGRIVAPDSTLLKWRMSDALILPRPQVETRVFRAPLPNLKAPAIEPTRRGLRLKNGQ